MNQVSVLCEPRFVALQGMKIKWQDYKRRCWCTGWLGQGFDSPRLH